MTFTDDIKKALIKTHKDTNEESLDLYISRTAKLYNDIHGIKIPRKTRLETPEEFKKRQYYPLNKEKSFNWIKDIDMIEKYFDEQNRSISTRTTYYSGILEVIRAMDYPDEKSVKNLIKQRQEYIDQYNSIEDGLKSKRQEDSFIDVKIINDKIDLYEKKIKGGDRDPDLLQIWMILNIIRKFRFRNEIASLEFVDIHDYNKEKGNTEKNMIVMDPQGWFISKNKYKTSKRYGEVIIPLEGQILQDIKLYRGSTMKASKIRREKALKEGEPDPGDKLFVSSFQVTKRSTEMTSNALSKYLLNWSNKELPPVQLEDGSKKPRNLGSNMIVKVYESAEHGEGKASLQKQSKNRGNDPGTMMKHYVSTKNPKD